jgi:hypothetical protein
MISYFNFSHFDLINNNGLDLNFNILVSAPALQKFESNARVPHSAATSDETTLIFALVSNKNYSLSHLFSPE